MRTTYWIIAILFLSALLGTATPVHAGTMDVTGFPLMVGDCMTVVGMQHAFVAVGQTVDITAPDRDVFALVLYDGDGNAFAYIGISVGIGTWTATNWGWNYPILVQPQSRPFTLRIFDNTVPITTASGDLVGAQHGAIVDTFHYDPIDYGVCTHLPLATTPSVPTNLPLPTFTDGRLNNYDDAAPIAVYGLDRNGGRALIIYGIGVDGLGHGVLLVEAEQIAAVPECPEENTLIAANEALGIAVYRLTSCEFQINAPTHTGKTYTMIFALLYPNTTYTSFEA